MSRPYERRIKARPIRPKPLIATRVAISSNKNYLYNKYIVHLCYGVTVMVAVVFTVAPEVLSPDGKGVDLYKLATFTLSGVQALATKVDAQKMRIVSLETRSRCWCC